MPPTRRRQLRVCWRDGFDDRTLTFNDAPAQYLFLPDLDTLLHSAPWTLTSTDFSNGDHSDFYSLSEPIPANPQPIFRHVFATNPNVIGPPGKDFRAAVAIDGQWAICSTPHGDAVADTFRLTPNGWAFHFQLKPAHYVNTDWLPEIAFAHGQLLVPIPQSRLILRWSLSPDGFTQQASEHSDLANFGETIAAAGLHFAATGYLEKRPTLVLRPHPSGPLTLETRIAAKSEASPWTISLSPEWLAIATGLKRGPGDVHMYRASSSGWSFAHTLPRPSLPPEANFGASVKLLGSGLLVTSQSDSGLPPAAHFYRLSGDEWLWDSTLPLPRLDGEHACAWLGDLACIGFPYAYGATGQIAVLQKTAGNWSVAQVIALPNGRIGDRFGESLAFDGHHLIAGAPGSVAGGGCGHIFERIG